MMKKIVLSMIVAFTAAFGAFADDGLPLEIGITTGAYYTHYEMPEGGSTAEELNYVLNFYTSLRGGGSVYVGYMLNELLVTGIDLGFYYFSEEHSFVDIPIRSYVRLGFDSFNVEALGGIVYRNGIGLVNGKVTDAFESAYDVGVRLNMGYFYIETAKVIPIGNALPEATKYGLGVAVDLNLL